MVAPFDEAGIEVTFYPVKHGNGGLRQDVAPAVDCDLMLVMGYFGLCDAPEVPKGYGGVVVEDVTHSLLARSRSGEAGYRFGSLRKWCGVWTGGFAWRTDGTALPEPPVQDDSGYVEKRRRAMEDKAHYIETGEGGKGYLAALADAERWLDRCVGPMGAYRRDVEAALALDVRLLKESRTANAKALLEGLSGIRRVRPLFAEVREGDCPLFVPVLLEGRDSLREYLTANDVYCPVHWPPPSIHLSNGASAALYGNELSLVCDQRYGIGDMLRTIELIKTWEKTS